MDRGKNKDVAKFELSHCMLSLNDWAKVLQHPFYLRPKIFAKQTLLNYAS
jgi:hypothetical protein